MPKTLKEFLRVDENKTKLFIFLSEVAACRPQGYDKELYTTHGSDVLRSPTRLDVSNIALCSHEKADTHLILNSADAVVKGHRRFSIRTVDTDLLELAVALFDKIKPDERWVILGTGSHFRNIAIHELMAKMDSRYCNSLPIFHAFTGCDTVSFSGRGKKTVWATWRAFLEVTDAFIELEREPSAVSEESMSLLEICGAHVRQHQ